MINRRQWLGLSLGAGAALALEPQLLWAARQQIITRAIPSTGELLPIVGLGSSATFREVADSEDDSALRGVLRTMVERGGRVFDTAPSYGASEEVAGRIARVENITDGMFWATKMNGVQGPAGKLDPAIAQKQMETSLQRIGKRPLDLIQVHGLAGAAAQIGMLKEMKQSGQIRYIGVTTTAPQQYEQLQQMMRTEPLDFIGIDYAVDNRDIEEHILPLAQDRGIGVMVYQPFGRTRLWGRIGDRPLPDWAKEFDAHSWAQFMIKYVASHPAVTVVTPSTSQPTHMADNMGGAFGRLPDEAMRRRMAEYADALPAAPVVVPTPPAPAVVVPAAILDRYVGVYETESGFKLTFRREGAGLVAQLPGGQEATLIGQSETRLWDPRGATIEFQLDSDGTVTGLILEQGAQRTPAARIR